MPAVESARFLPSLGTPYSKMLCFATSVVGLVLEVGNVSVINKKPFKSERGCFRINLRQFFVGHGDLIQVVSDIRVEARLAVSQVLAWTLVGETVRGVEQPFASSTGIEVLLRDLPHFVLQHGKSIFGEINEFAMEGFRPRISLGESRLEFLVGFGHLPLGGRLATLVFGR